MDLIYDPQNGKATVLLGGVSYYNCKNDLECPGIAECHSQAQYSWIDGANSSVTQCICPPYLATVGANCTIPTSHTWGLFAISTITSITGIVSMLVCFLTLVTVIWNKVKRSHAFYLSLVPTFAAAFFAFLYSLQWQIRFVLVGNEVIGYIDGEPFRRTALWLIESSSFVLSLVFFVFCMINFSLLWIEVLNKASQVGVQPKSMKLYRRLLGVLYVVLLVTAITLVILDNYLVISYLAGPYFVLICVFYGIAWWKVRDTRHHLFPNQTSYSGGSTQSEHLRKLLNKVRIVAIQVFSLTLVMIICALGFGISPNEPYSWTQQYFGLCIFLCGEFDILTISVFLWQIFSASPMTKIDSKLEVGPAEQTIDN